jgi:hypothetical protein
LNDRTLEDLLRHPGIWRPGERCDPSARGLPTGFAVLDRALPAGGWPASGLVDLMIRDHGIGELRLLLPVVTRVIDDGRRALLVHPPCVPYAPAWVEHGVDLSRLLWIRGRDDEQALLVTERAARSGACGVVILWLTGAAPGWRTLRRLQLAAEEGCCLAVVLRDEEGRRAPSPAVLCARLEATGDTTGDTLRVHVDKCRGAFRGATVLEIDHGTAVTGSGTGSNPMPGSRNPGAWVRP